MNKKMRDFLLTLTLTDGMQLREVCPVCNGGQSSERSLSLNLQNSRLKWLCHRASCNNRGKILVGRQLSSYTGNSNATSKHQQEKQCKLDTQEPQLVPEIQLRIGALSSIQQQDNSSHMMNGGLDRQNTELTCPQGYVQRDVKDNQGKQRGAVFRRGPELPKHYAKDINRLDPSWCKLHFPSPIKSDIVLLVEDIISANKMNVYFPCVALLGVHLSVEKVEYLLTQGISSVIIALDNDATRQAIKLARKYAIASYVLPLQRDFKDETEERLQQIAEELRSKYGM